MVIWVSFSERELCVCQYVAGFCPSCSSLRWQCDHIFEELVMFTCVGIFIVTTTFFWSWYEIAVFCIDEWSIAFGRHCLDVAHIHHHSQFRFAGAARFDFDIQLGIGTCGHDTSHQFGERLLVHVEEHRANGWRDCVQCCGSDSGYVSRDVCRGSSLHWSGVLVGVFFPRTHLTS